jgi:hypothetical protein
MLNIQHLVYLTAQSEERLVKNMHAWANNCKSTLTEVLQTGNLPLYVYKSLPNLDDFFTVADISRMYAEGRLFLGSKVWVHANEIFRWSTEL